MSKNEKEEAMILIVRGAIDRMQLIDKNKGLESDTAADKLFNELQNLKWDKKAWMKGESGEQTCPP